MNVGAVIRKYEGYISNLEWHIEVNKPPKIEVEKINSQLDYYKEMVSDLKQLQSERKTKAK